MKQELLDGPRAMTLSLALTILMSLTAGAFLMPGLAYADIHSDLKLTFSREGRNDESGYLVGDITNRSTRFYGCVELRFSLTRQSGRPPTDISFQVRGIGPRATAPFRYALPYPTGFKLKSMQLCPARRATPPAPREGVVQPAPRPAAPAPPPPSVRRVPAPAPVPSSGRCSISGRATGLPVRARTRLNGPLQTFDLKQVGVYVNNGRMPVSVSNLDSQRAYRLENLPVGQSLRLEPLGVGWRYDRQGKTVSCNRSGQNLRVDIHIEGITID